MTNRQFTGLCKAFANSSSEDSNLLKTQLSKIIQLGEFLSRLLVPLMKVSLPLMKIVLMPLAKSVLLPLVLTAAVSAEFIKMF